MKTRRVLIGLFFSVEHRTEGWYYRQNGEEEWEGPFLNVGELTEEFADYFDAYIRLLYELTHKEAPR
jgi:hypothetical protein